MMNFVVFKKAQLAILLSVLVTSSPLVKANLRGSSVTQIENGRDAEPNIVMPPPPALPEGGLDMDTNERQSVHSVRSRSRHGGADDFSIDAPLAEKRIINGFESVSGTWPYYALMIGFNDNGGMFSRGCGATLIEDEWILTAAHCGCRSGDLAWIGAYNADSTRVRAKIKECYTHPSYSWPRHDYALCRTEVAHPNRPQVSIAPKNYNPSQNEPMTVIGTGAIQEGTGPTNKLREAVVEYKDKDTCENRYGSFRKDSMLCAGGGDTDACQGDSGGPLFYTDSGGNPVQIGIVSWGSGCGREGNPGVYADVREERDWIDDIICNNGVNSVGSMCAGATTTTTTTSTPTTTTTTTTTNPTTTTTTPTTTTTTPTTTTTTPPTTTTTTTTPPTTTTTTTTTPTTTTTTTTTPTTTTTTTLAVPSENEVYVSNFDGGWDGWNDGGSDARRVSSSTFCSSGSYCIQLRDNSGSASSMRKKFDEEDMSAYDQLRVDFTFYADSMERGEDFCLEINDGNGWEIVEEWVSSTDFANGEFTDASAIIDSDSFFSGGSFGSTVSLRFRCNASSNADKVYIDNVRLVGLSN